MMEPRTVELLRREDAEAPRVVDGETFMVENVTRIRADPTTIGPYHWVELTQADGTVREYNDVHMMNVEGFY